MFSSREAVHSVVSFKTIRRGVVEQDCWCVFLVARGMRSRIATQETTFKLNGDGFNAKE